MNVAFNDQWQEESLKKTSLYVCSFQSKHNKALWLDDCVVQNSRAKVEQSVQKNRHRAEIEVHLAAGCP